MGDQKSKNRKFSETPSEKPVSLKETSSTETADFHRKELPKYPSFFKSKSKASSTQDFGNFSKDDFKIIRKLGAGKFGTVQLVKYARDKI